jgi:hypothetical protein
LRRRGRAVLLNLCLLAATLLVAAIALEGVLRVLKLNSLSNVELVPGKGLRRVPGSTYVNRKEGYSEGRYNALGFRDVERQTAKPAGTMRIEVLGDSFIEALQVPLEQTLTAVLERKLNDGGGSPRYEVLNLGQSGFGTTEECQRFEHFGRQLDPDVVVLALFPGNDVRNNSRVLNTESVTYYYTLQPDGGLILDTSVVDRYESNRSILQRAVQEVKRHSYLASFVSERLFLLRRQSQGRKVRAAASDPGAGGPSTLPVFDDLNVYVADPPGVWSDAWAVTLAVLAKTRDDVEATGARFVVVMIPAAEQIDAEAQSLAQERAGRTLDWDHPDTVLDAYARERGIRFLSLTPRFRETYARTGQPLYGMGEINRGHWNRHGNELAADVVLDFLRREGVVR